MYTNDVKGFRRRVAIIQITIHKLISKQKGGNVIIFSSYSIGKVIKTGNMSWLD